MVVESRFLKYKNMSKQEAFINMAYEESFPKFENSNQNKRSRNFLQYTKEKHTSLESHKKLQNKSISFLCYPTP